MTGHPIDTVVDAALADGSVIGTSVIALQHGRLLYTRKAGLADRETGAPVRDDSLFLLASVAKPFTTAAVLRLSELGTLQLGAPVTSYLPEFRPRMADGRTPEITLHQLLTHTAGLTYRFFAPVGEGYHAADVSDGVDDIGITLADNLRRIVSVPLSFEPGTGWGYSIAIDVLGAVVEQVTGQQLGDVVAELITGPLGIQDTGFRTDTPERIVAHYGLVPGEGLTRIGANTEIPTGPRTFVRFHSGRVVDPTAYHSGGGGMVGNAEDVAAFLDALRIGGDTILTSATVDQMFTAHVGAEAETDGPGWGFGYGGAVLIDPIASSTPQSAGTLQWGGSYGHRWFIDRARELTLVALTNVGYEGLFGDYTRNIRDAVYEVAD